MSREINADLLKFLGGVSEALAKLPDGKVEYGEWYVSEVVIRYGDGPSVQEDVGKFLPNDFGGYDYHPTPLGGAA